MTSWLLMAVLPMMLTTSSTIADMRWERRVLLITAPSDTDAALIEQHHIIDGWKAGAEARDLSLVEVVGDRVAGARDAAATLRQQYRLPAKSFSAILIGKDGGEKLRGKRPFSAKLLEETIDAMPMRRSGQR
ncbi:DUF4174 domain-containing protein [Sphingomonas sp.]|uniref:DUF4174 domain-containing protein n=1 Tax=Sphingomonas sp. TaxID=28214 RepID=UPI003B3B7FC1